MILIINLLMILVNYYSCKNRRLIKITQITLCINPFSLRLGKAKLNYIDCVNHILINI